MHKIVKKFQLFFLILYLMFSIYLTYSLYSKNTKYLYLHNFITFILMKFQILNKKDYFYLTRLILLLMVFNVFYFFIKIFYKI